MWTSFITVAVAVRATTLLGQALLLLGAYSPAFAALWLTARYEGSTGISNLLSGILLWRVGLRWYVFAAGYMLFIKLASAIIHRLIWGAWTRFGDLPWYMVAAAVLFSTPFQAGEEIGWRGYALPRMAARFGLPWASVLLGVIWAGWHLPQFFIREADTYHQAFLVWALQVTALSVAFAWLYIRTNRSLLLPMLLHSAINNSKDVVPSAMSSGPSRHSCLENLSYCLDRNHAVVGLRGVLSCKNVEDGQIFLHRKWISVIRSHLINAL